MSYYKCEYCGANLDPGEQCDCTKEYVVGDMVRVEKIGAGYHRIGQVDYINGDILSLTFRIRGLVYRKEDYSSGDVTMAAGAGKGDGKSA